MLFNLNFVLPSEVGEILDVDINDPVIADRLNKYIVYSSTLIDDILRSYISNTEGGIDVLPETTKLHIKQACTYLVLHWWQNGIALSKISTMMSTGQAFNMAQSNPHEPDYVPRNFLTAMNASGLYKNQVDFSGLNKGQVVDDIDKQSTWHSTFTEEEARGWFLTPGGLTSVDGSVVYEISAVGVIPQTVDLSVSGSHLGARFSSKLIDDNESLPDRGINPWKGLIDANIINIANNSTSIGTNTSNIIANTSDIGANSVLIATNVTNIATNETEISANTDEISTNRTNIATNVINIATNTSNIGDLSTLETSDKDDLVGAINAVHYTVMENKDHIGTVANLTTDEKTNTVGAINEIDSHADTNAANIDLITQEFEKSFETWGQYAGQPNEPFPPDKLNVQVRIENLIEYEALDPNFVNVNLVTGEFTPAKDGSVELVVSGTMSNVGVEKQARLFTFEDGIQVHESPIVSIVADSSHYYRQIVRLDNITAGKVYHSEYYINDMGGAGTVSSKGFQYEIGFQSGKQFSTVLSSEVMDNSLALPDANINKWKGLIDVNTLAIPTKADITYVDAKSWLSLTQVTSPDNYFSAEYITGGSMLHWYADSGSFLDILIQDGVIATSGTYNESSFSYVWSGTLQGEPTVLDMIATNTASIETKTQLQLASFPLYDNNTFYVETVSPTSTNSQYSLVAFYSVGNACDLLIEKSKMLVTVSASDVSVARVYTGTLQGEPTHNEKLATHDTTLTDHDARIIILEESAGTGGVSTSSALTDDSTTNPIDGINPWKTQIDNNESDIGNLNALNTVDNSSLVGAINELDAHANSNTDSLEIVNDKTEVNATDIGDMNGLDTANRYSLVVAINEVNTLTDTNTGTLSSHASTINSNYDRSTENLNHIGNMSYLQTLNKDNLVNSNNELLIYTENNKSKIADNLARIITLEESGGTGGATVSSALTDDYSSNPLDGINPWRAQNLENKDHIGLMSYLNTQNKSSLVYAINEVNNQVGVNESQSVTNETEIGELNGLNTQSRTNLVTAINEVHGDVDHQSSTVYTNTQDINLNKDDIGVMTSLSTDTKYSLVNAINEVDLNTDDNTTRIQALEAGGGTGGATVSSALTDDYNYNPIDGINPWKNQIDSNNSDIGNLDVLATDLSSNLVAAVNEVNLHADDNAIDITDLLARVVALEAAPGGGITMQEALDTLMPIGTVVLSNIKPALGTWTGTAVDAHNTILFGAEDFGTKTPGFLMNHNHQMQTKAQAMGFGKYSDGYMQCQATTFDYYGAEQTTVYGDGLNWLGEHAAPLFTSVPNMLGAEGRTNDDPFNRAAGSYLGLTIMWKRIA